MIDISEPITIGKLTIKNRLFLAPVDGVFDQAFRTIAVRHGVGLTCSEMLPARGIKHSVKLRNILRKGEEEKIYQVQLSDHDPDVLAETAREIENEALADIIDINMGCPSRTVVGSGNGAALLRLPELVRNIVASVRKAISLPLTVKMRAGWDADTVNAVEIAGIADSEGADMITVHGRTRSQFFSGKADWDIIAEVKSKVAAPVIGNGDVASSADATRMLVHSGCDGVMIARGAFGNPWLIDRILKGDDGIRPSFTELRDEVLTQIALQCERLEEKFAIRSMRKHLVFYVRGLQGAAAFRKEAMLIPDRARLEKLIRDFFDRLKRRSDQISAG